MRKDGDSLPGKSADMNYFKDGKNLPDKDGENLPGCTKDGDNIPDHTAKEG